MNLAKLKAEQNVDLDSLDLKITDFENILNVYQDKKKNWHYNLNMTMKVSVDEQLKKEHICQYDSHWPLISYNLYGTTRLAWLLMQLNNITCKNSFKPILAGEKIVYIDKSYIRTIVSSMQQYNV